MSSRSNVMFECVALVLNMVEVSFYYYRTLISDHPGCVVLGVACCVVYILFIFNIMRGRRCFL